MLPLSCGQPLSELWSPSKEAQRKIKTQPACITGRYALYAKYRHFLMLSVTRFFAEPSSTAHMRAAFYPPGMNAEKRSQAAYGWGSSLETPTGWQVSRQQSGQQCNGWPLSGVQSGFDTLRRVKLRLLYATLKGAYSHASQSRGSWWSHMRAAIYRPDTNAEKITRRTMRYGSKTSSVTSLFSQRYFWSHDDSNEGRDLLCRHECSEQSSGASWARASCHHMQPAARVPSAMQSKKYIYSEMYVSLCLPSHDCVEPGNRDTAQIACV